MKKYWFSFSFKGKNQGICIVEEENEIKAEQKTIDLGIHPEYDDILCFELNSLDKDPDLELDKLYSSEEMIELGYGVVTTVS